jgi:hypothetical protein
VRQREWNDSDAKTVPYELKRCICLKQHAMDAIVDQRSATRFCKRFARPIGPGVFGTFCTFRTRKLQIPLAAAQIDPASGHHLESTTYALVTDRD